MLQREHVVRGGEYQVDGERWWVFVIHPSTVSCERLTLMDCDETEYVRRLSRVPFERSRMRHMTMRRFREAAALVDRHD